MTDSNLIAAVDVDYRDPHAVAACVFRGVSRNPLFVSAVGTDLDDAARDVERMHGEYRAPTLLKRVDRLCRSASGPV